MKKFLSILFVIIIITSISIPVFATGNEWVYDESKVVSEETENYIKTLNEEVFTTYKNKPQLAFVIVDDIPSEYYMDEYKLLLFNKYGVGTKEENCGMLFVLSLNSREYGFEIGDGYKEGTLLRQDLSRDFITSDIKSLLQAEDYDGAVLQITNHLEQIMADEEAGIYAQKEIEREQQNAEALAALKSLGKAFVILIFSGACLFALYHIVMTTSKYVYRVVKTEKLMEKYSKHVALLSLSKDEIQTQILSKRRIFSEVEAKFMFDLYDIYTTEQLKELDKKRSAINFGSEYIRYHKKLMDVNCVENFINLQLKDVDTIIYDMNKMIKHEKEIEEANLKKISDFVISQRHLIPEFMSEKEIISTIFNRCMLGRLISDESIESIFNLEIKEASFKYEYEKFLEEHKDEIDLRHLNSSSFYDTLRKTDNYMNYNPYHSHGNFMWMLPLLMVHTQKNKATEERRIAAEANRRRQQQNFNRNNSFGSSSFGTSFGGGFSSGGGFSGGW